MDTHIISLFKKVEHLAREKECNFCAIELKENQTHDYCWTAKAIMYSGDIENQEDVSVEGFGLEGHEALLDLIKKL